MDPWAVGGAGALSRPTTGSAPAYGRTLADLRPPRLRVDPPALLPEQHAWTMTHSFAEIQCGLQNLRAISAGTAMFPDADFKSVRET